MWHFKKNKNMDIKSIEEIIKLSKGIVDDLTDEKISLSKALRKSKRITVLANDHVLENFIRVEIEGYQNEENIPEYRRKDAESIGQFKNRFSGVVDTIPLQFDEYIKKIDIDPQLIYTRLLPYSIPEIEDFLHNKDNTDLLIEYPMGLFQHAKKLLSADSEKGWDLVAAYFKLDISAFNQILNITQNRLIELLLKVEKNIKDEAYQGTEYLFENGSHFDAMYQISEIISKAKNSIILIDGYVNEKTLNFFSNKEAQVEIKILTDKRAIDERFMLFVDSFNSQYRNLEVKSSKVFHDRFLIIDNKNFYHLGASIKDAGNKTFMFSKVEEDKTKENIVKKFNEEWDK